MNILDLDYDSLQMIMTNLDIFSHKSVLQTCKLFNHIGKKQLNVSKWKYEIQKIFVYNVFTDKQLTYETKHFLACLEMSLKALLKTLEYMNLFSYLQCDEIAVTDTLKLLIEATPTDHDSKISTLLANVSFDEQLKINCWHLFRIGHKKHVVICGIEHPDSSIRSYISPVIALTQDEDMTYCYDVTLSEEFGENCRDYILSDSMDVFEPVCKELRKVFIGKEELFIPSKLIKLANTNIIQEIKRSKCLPDVFNQEFQNKCYSHSIYRMKKSWHVTACNLLDKTPDFIKFLELFCELVPVHHSIEFVEQLIMLIKPCSHVIHAFACKKSLFLSDARKLLLSVFVNDRNTCVQLLPDKILELSLLRQDQDHVSVHVFVKNYLDFELDAKFESNEEYDKLVALFMKTLMPNDTTTNTKIAGVSTDILQFIMSLIGVDIHTNYKVM